MPYAEATTTAKLIQRVNAALKLEGTDSAGKDPVVVADALNRAARGVVDELTDAEPRELLATVSRTVNRGDAAIALPDGSNPAEPRARRVIEANWRASSTGTPGPLEILEGRELVDTDGYPENAFSLCREGLTLRWLSSTGAPAAGTVTLRYLAALAPIDPAVRDATPLAQLAPEFTDVVVDLAVAKLLPASHAALVRYEAGGRERLAALVGLTRRFVHTAGRHIRSV